MKPKAKLRKNRKRVIINTYDLMRGNDIVKTAPLKCEFKTIAGAIKSLSEDDPIWTEEEAYSKLRQLSRSLRETKKLLEEVLAGKTEVQVPELYGELAARRDAGLKKLSEYQAEVSRFTPAHYRTLKTEPLDVQLNALVEFLELVSLCEILPTQEELEALEGAVPQCRILFAQYRELFFLTQAGAWLISLVSTQLEKYATNLKAHGVDIQAIRNILAKVPISYTPADLEALRVCASVAHQIKEKLPKEFPFTACFDVKSKAWDVTWKGYFEGVRILELRKSKSLRTVFECLRNASWDSNACEGVVDLRGVTKAIYPAQFKIAQYQLAQELDKRGIDIDGARSGYANEVRMDLEREIWARQNRVTIRAIKEGIRRGLKRIQDGVPNIRKVRKAVGELVVAKGQRIVTKLSSDDVSVRIP